MRQARGNLDFPEESIGAKDLSEVRPEHLEGHPALVAEVAGEIDQRHPAPADLALNRVAARQGRGEPRLKVLHGH